MQNKADEVGWTYSDKVISCKAPGSSFYRRNGTWSFLDVIMVSPALNQASSTWKANLNSFSEVVSHNSQMRKDQKTGQMIPNRFDINTGGEVSDHLPVALNISSAD